MKEIKQPLSLITSYYTKFKDFWQGFDEREACRDPITVEKQQMIRYPVISSLIQMSALPIIGAKVTIDGNEQQAQFLESWFNRYYRTLVNPLAQKAMTWGFCAGEKVYSATDDGRWMVINAFYPQPYNCTLLFRADSPGVAGFQWNGQNVTNCDDRGNETLPGIAYYPFRGDAISKPYGESMLNDLFWVWQLLMKEWTTWAMYKRLKVIPPWLVYYPPDLQASSSTTAADVNKSTAKTTLEAMKNMSGVTLPLTLKTDDGTYVKGWQVEEAGIESKDVNFTDAIRILNSMLYIGALTPERLIEQFKDTGSQAMVETQANFYTEYIVKTRLEEIEEHILQWIVDPMLRVNFGKVDATFDLNLGDAMKTYYADLIKIAVQSGDRTFVDLPELARRAGLPVAEVENPAPEVVKAERVVQGVGMDFQTRGEERKALEKIAEKWIRPLNKSTEDLATKIYDRMIPPLREWQGKVVLRVGKLFDRKFSDRDLQDAVQTPRTIYAGIADYMDDAWYLGMKTVMEFAPRLNSRMERPSRKVELQLRRIATGFQGSDRIVGEGELLERKLYLSLLGVTDKTEAENALTSGFNDYIEHTLPDRIMNAMHEAVQSGVMDAIAELRVRAMKKQAGK